MHESKPFIWCAPQVTAAALALASLTACAAQPVVEPQGPIPLAQRPALSQAEAEDSRKQRDFASWVEAFRTTARAAGIDERTLAAAFDGVRYLPRVIELDRAQPEFTRTVWDYLDVAVSPQRVANGLVKLQQFGAEADAAAARYGVPSHVLVAIWGVESNYGGLTGNIPAIDALATLCFDGRREAWARSELLAALKILQSGDIARTQMVGSWAGAMGQTQFLPSVFLAYAVDADGDGRRDIWGSMADVMASTANYFAQAGWQPGQPWGVEVKLPPNFDVGRADSAERQTSAKWLDEGVQGLDGAPLPEFADSAIMLPAGARGPAFLVGPNFRVILRFNNSGSYALAIGLLAQRLAGGPAVQAPWPRDLQGLTRTQLTELQTALNRLGFAAGAPDGMMGPATREGLRRYQRSVGLPADGYPTLDLLERLALR